MRESPILFSTEMVKAILDGRKTCTRRAIKFPNGMTGRPIGKAGDNSNPLGVMYPGGIKRPPCQPGDILYVRETWCSAYDGEKFFYLADKLTNREERSLLNYDDAKWHQSIHMPKEAARIWLKVIDVRIEQLQDITETQAQAEGCNSGLLTGPCTARGQFEKLWNSTIKKSDIDRYGWSANPWVWIIEFERCEKTGK